MSQIIKFFDKLEDKVRIKLSHYPITFAFIGGFAIVEFWRGVWDLTDYFFMNFGFHPTSLVSSISSIIVSSFLLLITGLYVSLFLSDESVILSGRKNDTRKAFEKTEEEIKDEEDQILRLERKVDSLSKDIKDLKDVFSKK